MGSDCLLKLAEVVLSEVAASHEPQIQPAWKTSRERRRAVNHHPGTYKGSYKRASRSYFTSLLDYALRAHPRYTSVYKKIG